MFSLNSRSRHLLFNVIFLTVIAACSGGDSVPVNRAPTVNAGANVTVDENAVVQLSPSFSDDDGEVVEFIWSQTSGPTVTLEVVDLEAGQYQFVAPDTGLATRIELVFELTVTDDDGASTSDQKIVSVNRINDAPAVNAGNDQSVEGLREVNLNGSAADIDGEVVSFSWEQNSGTPVTINNPNQAVASFTAPSTNTELELVFSLSVLDDEGARSSDSVTFTVTPENAPLLSMIFPPERGGYNAETIAAFGGVEARGDASIESVRIETAAGEVNAEVGAEGNWRANAVPVPQAMEVFTLTVTATDSLGLQATRQAELATSVIDIGEGAEWPELAAMDLDPEHNRAWVMTVGPLIADVKFMPVNLRTGLRGASVTDITNEDQGPTDSANVDMIYNRADGYLYYIISPADTALPPKIIRINPESGVRELVSGETRGSGEFFDNPISLDEGPNGTLLVADYALNVIFSVDIASGDRSVIADETSSELSVQIPLIVYWSEALTELALITPNWADELELLSLDLATQTTALEALLSPFANPLRVAYGFAMDHDDLFAYYLTFEGTVLEYDLVLQEEYEMDFGFASNLPDDIYRGLAYDQENDLLYAITEDNALYVIDVISESAVVLSQD